MTGTTWGPFGLAMGAGFCLTGCAGLAVAVGASWAAVSGLLIGNWVLAVVSAVAVAGLVLAVTRLRKTRLGTDECASCVPAGKKDG